jgi:hypothetical protein
LTNATPIIRRRRSIATLAALGTLAAASVVGASAQASPQSSATATQSSAAQPSQQFSAGKYIVLMRGAPAAAYDGSRAGYERTAPRGNAQYQPSTQAARDYRALLKQQQRQVAGAVDATPLYHYADVTNGFAARLSAEQALALSKRSDVLAVVKNEIQQPDTVKSPEFLGLSGAGGVWQGLGGADPADGAGDGIVVGIIDTGMDDESASFAAVGDEGAPAGWNGVCQTGERRSVKTFQCNDKLIGGRYYLEGFGGPKGVAKHEFLSPDDYDGHGSHTGSTSAGNSGVEMVVDGVNFGEGSGMAPAAKVAAYKVCWSGQGCATVDSVKAINDAVRDGVDVLNYSISGTLSNPIDPVEMAFMYAADAGVFVAASAGNSGPAASTVAHPSPWLTTVAAATHTLDESTVLLGDGQRFIGASITGGIPAQTPLVRSRDIAAAAEADAALCLPGSLDPATLATGSQIVVCERGVNARVEKSQVVADAGGEGMILVNMSAIGTAADLHTIPTVHLEFPAVNAIYAYIAAAGGNATAAILAGESTGSTSPAPPAIAGFSSRGPSRVADGDLLKPDVAAPGVSVLAAVAPEGNGGRNFDFLSGTSMSSPHIAGLSALIIQAHPRWSPMAVKSAMMTTAGDLTDTQSPFDQGAGFVNPRGFLNPGLVFDSDLDDWSDYLAGQGVRYSDGRPFTDNPIQASQLNLPSIAVNKLAGRETIYRQVTNVGSSGSTYNVSVSGLEGIAVAVQPQKFRLRPGQSKTVRIDLDRTTAPFGEYTEGNLTWQDRSHVVRIPIVANPVAIQAPAEIDVAANGSTEVTTKAGFDGTMSHVVRGLVAGNDTPASGGNTGGADFDPGLAGNYKQSVVVESSEQLIRLQALADFPDDDLDLYLLSAAGKIVAASATGAASETLTLQGLAAGTYTAYVQPWAVHDGQATTTFTFREFKVSTVDAGNMSVSPQQQQVVKTGTNTWTVTTSGLDASRAYLGWIGWLEGEQLRTKTIVNVN